MKMVFKTVKKAKKLEEHKVLRLLLLMNNPIAVAAATVIPRSAPHASQIATNGTSRSAWSLADIQTAKPT